MTLSHSDADFASYEIIRPAAVLSEAHARRILQGLAHDDVQDGGHWWTRVGTWRRYQEPWAPGADEPGEAIHVGTISCVYDSPNRHYVTVFRVSMTSYGLREGWTTELLCDDAFRHAGLTFATCPRASLAPLPEQFREEKRATHRKR
ncbi:MAG: hypothetical protein M3Z02_03465 [Actinomycetota bacterium]|nr:hypothetical protein [Actinomycetota bacterium]